MYISTRKLLEVITTFLLLFEAAWTDQETVGVLIFSPCTVQRQAKHIFSRQQ